MKLDKTLIEADATIYNKHFPVNPNPFISEAFIELNRRKAEKGSRN